MKGKVDITKALSPSCKIKREDGSTLWIAFKYERIWELCFTCGKVDHSVRAYPTSNLELGRAMDEPSPYGVWMKVSPTSNMKFEALTILEKAVEDKMVELNCLASPEQTVHSIGNSDTYKACTQLPKVSQKKETQLTLSETFRP